MWTDVDGIAKHLCVSKETIYRMLKNRSIPSHRVGKLWRFDLSEVDASIKNNSKEKRKNKK